MVKYRILHVNDNPDMLQFFELSLKQYAYDNQTTESHNIFLTHPVEHRGVVDPREALYVALEYQPHIAIVDYRMPFLDGLSVIAFLQNHPELNSVRIIPWQPLIDWNPELIEIADSSIWQVTTPENIVRSINTAIAKHIEANGELTSK